MRKMQLAKSHFRHFETFLMLFEKNSQKKKSSKTYFATLLFCTKFSKSIKNASKWQKM